MSRLRARNNVMTPQVAGSGRSMAAEILAHDCAGISSPLIVGRFTSWPTTRATKPFDRSRAWLSSGTRLMTTAPPVRLSTSVLPRRTATSCLCANRLASIHRFWKELLDRTELTACST